MKRHISLLLILIPCIIYAQPAFKPGFVVLNNGDTLSGLIDYTSNTNIRDICRFKLSDTDSVHLFTPNEIKEFKFLNSKYYISKQFNNHDRIFVEFLIKGKLNIYCFRENLQDHFLVEKDDLPIKELNYEEGIKTKNNVDYFYQSTYHIGLLEEATKDAPGLRMKIEKIKTPTQDNLIQLSKSYQKIVCQNEDCIIYEKKIPPIKVSIEPVLGFTYYFHSSLIVPELGLNLWFWLPRVNEKLSLKSGIIFHNTKESNVDDPSYSGNLLKIPIQIQYVFSGKIFRPKVSIGSNFFLLMRKENNYYLSSFQISSGLLIKIRKNLDFSTSLSLDTYPLILSVASPIADFKTQLFKPISSSLDAGLIITF